MTDEIQAYPLTWPFARPRTSGARHSGGHHTICTKSYAKGGACPRTLLRLPLVEVSYAG
jgi:hypothetical protein